MISWFFWNPFRRSVIETLKEVEKRLPLKEVGFSRYPVPTITGNYFGFKIILEGGRRKKEFRFLATIELPQSLQQRVFLAHEKRKTPFKSVASLKLVSTPNARLNQTFLLLAGDEAKAKAVFQPYLCGRIVALENQDWQFDAHAETAHLELWQMRLNAFQLSEVLKVVAECLNALLTAETA